MTKKLILGSFVALVALSAGLAQATTPYANATVQGALAPGVYGRIDIGNAPPPPLIYAQPIVVYRTPVAVQQPLYLHVPPGHAKKWSKHCAKYNACGQPVYFVRVAGDDDFERRRGRDDDRDDKHYGKGKDKDKHHGKHKD